MYTKSLAVDSFNLTLDRYAIRVSTRSHQPSYTLLSFWSDYDQVTPQIYINN